MCEICAVKLVFIFKRSPESAVATARQRWPASGIRWAIMQILLNTENTQSILITKSLLFSFVGSSTIQLVSFERAAEITRSKVERRAWRMEIKSRWGKKRKRFVSLNFIIHRIKSRALCGTQQQKKKCYLSSLLDALSCDFWERVLYRFQRLFYEYFATFFFPSSSSSSHKNVMCSCWKCAVSFHFLRLTKCFTFAWKIRNKWKNIFVRNVVLFFVHDFGTLSSHAYFRISSCSSIYTQLKQQQQKIIYIPDCIKFSVANSAHKNYMMHGFLVLGHTVSLQGPIKAMSRYTNHLMFNKAPDDCNDCSLLVAHPIPKTMHKSKDFTAFSLY